MGQINCVTKLHYALIDVCIEEVDDASLSIGDRSVVIL